MFNPARLNPNFLLPPRRDVELQNRRHAGAKKAQLPVFGLNPCPLGPACGIRRHLIARAKLWISGMCSCGFFAPPRWRTIPDSTPSYTHHPTPLAPPLVPPLSSFPSYSCALPLYSPSSSSSFLPVLTRIPFPAPTRAMHYLLFILTVYPQGSSPQHLSHDA